MIRTHSLLLRAAALSLALLIPSMARAQDASPQLAQTIDSLAAQMAPGQRPVSRMHGAYGPYREGVSFIVNLKAGRCYTFVGAGGAGVGDVDMFLFDPTNRRVALDRRDDAWMNLTYCAPFAGPFRVELKVKNGAGEVGFRVYSAGGGGQEGGDYGDDPPRAAPPPPPPPPPVAPPPVAGGRRRPAPAPAAAPEAPRDALLDQLQQMAAAMAPGQRMVLPPLRGFISEGRNSDQMIQLEAGRCYTILSISSPSVPALFTYLWAPYTDKRLATDRASSSTSRLQVCTTMPGPYHFQAKADEGAGEFRTGVYAP